MIKSKREYFSHSVSKIFGFQISVHLFSRCCICQAERISCNSFSHCFLFVLVVYCRRILSSVRLLFCYRLHARKHMHGSASHCVKPFFSDLPIPIYCQMILKFPQPHYVALRSWAIYALRVRLYM